MNLRKQPLVSIVTPVYNGEPYLIECIESVLAQTYKNWDYTIINNCSTDRTLEIAEMYASSDPRIRVITNDTFVEIIENHNIAFRHISSDSKYCKVVLGDDWIFPDCISQMVAVAEDNPTVGIVGAYGLRGESVDWDGLPYPSTVVSGRQICRLKLLKGIYVFGSPTSLLIRSDIIRTKENFFNVKNIHADSESCFEILTKYDFSFIHQVLTFTRTDNDSTISMCRRFNTYYLGRMCEIIKYGPIFLEKNEYNFVFKKFIEDYYKFLAESVIEFKKSDFWNYHKAKASEFGHPIENKRIAIALIKRIFDALLNPKRTIEGLIRRIKR